MAEEIRDASLVVPKSMVWSFLLNVPFTFGLLLTYLFCIGDVREALASPTGFPFMYVFHAATGSVRGATALTIVVLVLLVMITISSLASTSRQTYAFARDRGLPFSRWLSVVSFVHVATETGLLTLQVHPVWRVPVNAIIFTTMFSVALSLINIGSTVAFNAMLSLSTVALMATYVISVGCVAWKRVTGQPLPSSRWSLGRAGLPINCVALLYASWAFFWSFWPNSYSITAENFNWACVLFVALMGVAAGLYILDTTLEYEGPVVKTVARIE